MGMCSTGDGICVPRGEPAKNPTCPTNVGSSCLFYDCGAHQYCGPGHRCMCRYGSCVQGGGCAPPPDDRHPTCNVDTGGKCYLYGCHQNRGPTRCFYGHCLCDKGTCASDGACLSKPETELLVAEAAEGRGEESHANAVIAFGCMAVA